MQKEKGNITEYVARGPVGLGSESSNLVFGNIRHISIFGAFWRWFHIFRIVFKLDF